MRPAFLGIPWLAWAIPCAALALLYLFFWPRPTRNAAPRSPLRHFVLRWVHALAWALLTSACLVQAAALPRAGTVAGGLALVAVACYAVFVGALLRERRIVRAFERDRKKPDAG